MSTLEEIEAAIPGLTPDEIDGLARRLDEIRASRAGHRTDFTGEDAVRWWREITHLSPDEAEAFARDIEGVHTEVNKPPTPPPWA